jgi:PAS domain S-box-containing protein
MSLKDARNDAWTITDYGLLHGGARAGVRCHDLAAKEMGRRVRRNEAGRRSKSNDARRNTHARVVQFARRWNDFFNQRWHDYTGLTPEESNAWGWKVALHPADLGTLLDKWRAVLASGDPIEIETRLRRYDGEYRWFLFRAEPFRDELGNIVRWYGTSTDIEHLKRTEALLAAGQQTLEMISRGAPLADILANLCSTIDALSTNSTSTVLLADPDGKRLWPGAGPAVPDLWTQAISPVTIGPREGSCGTAAFLRTRVIISDVASDPLCVSYRGRALANGIRASWSQPLISKFHEFARDLRNVLPRTANPQ